MRIAVFTDTYLPQINGVVTSISMVVEELEHVGHEIVIVAPQVGRGTKSTEKVIRCKSLPYPFQREHRMSMPYARKLKKIFTERPFDIIHIHTPFAIGLLGHFLSWKHKVPLVYTYHTNWSEYTHYFPLLPKNIIRKLERQMHSKAFCNQCSHIIAPSTDVKKELDIIGTKTPVSVIPNSISPPKRISQNETARFRKEHGIDPRCKTLIFIGRLGLEKNLEFLLKCFAKTAEVRPNIQLLLVGDGPLKKDLTKQADALGVGDRVIFTGYVDRTGVFTALEIADILSFPSKSEVLPMSLIEAISMGVPAVCLEANGMRDILEHGKGGILTEHTEEAYCDGLRRMIDDDEFYARKKMEALERARYYSCPSVAREFVTLYREVIRTYSRDAE